MTTSPASFYADLLSAVMQSAHESDGPAQDLLRVLTWWATQDPYGQPFDWTRAEQQMFRQYQDAATRPLTNSNPFASFNRWAVALGFAERSPDGLVPDATRAMRTVVSLLGHRQIVQLATFLADVRERVPVLDGGRLARQERKLLQEGTSLRVDAAAVDVYLTHALLRCHEDGILTLSAPSDAERVLMSDGAASASWSHIEVGGVAA